MAFKDLIDNPWFKNLGVPAIGSMVDAGINFGMMVHQNRFNAKQAQITREWNEEMDNTKYQRQVADMKAAGVNPALAMDGGVTTQAGSNATAQGATPAYMNFAGMANMVQALSQARLNDSQAKNIDIDTEKKRAEANYYSTLNDKEAALIVGINIDNQYKDEFLKLRNEGQRKVNAMTDAEISQTYQNIEKLKAETDLAIKQAATEEERVRLMITQEILNKANSYRINSLVEYEKNYYAAKTDEAKASAKLMAAQEAWQNGLIDEGAIEATVRKLNAEASEAEIKAIMDETRHQLGIEKAEVANKKADTASKYVNSAANAISVLADTTFKIVGAVASGGLTLGIPQPHNPIGFN